MSIWNKRPAEDVETERARLMARADVRSHEMAVERTQKIAERQQRAEEKKRDRQDTSEIRKQKRLERTEFRASLAENAGKFVAALQQKLTLILPLLFVNGFAVVGQAGFAHDRLHWQLLAAAGFAATLESIALYIGYHAHAALMAGDSATKLRLASYSVGAVIGGINYEHYAGPHGEPTAMAVIFGLLSLISPWLWAMHGRYKNRRRLEQLGLIDERAPHFSAAKWLHFPLQTFFALRFGIGHNMKDPAAAWDGYQRERAARKVRRRAERMRRRMERDKRPEVRVTIARVQTYRVREQKERLKLFWVEDLSALSLSRTSGSETGAPPGSGSGPGGGSETQAGSGSETGSANGSRDQVPNDDRTGSGNGSETSEGNGSKTGPKRRSRSRSRTRSKKQVPDRLAEARSVDKAYLAENGRHIPAEKLAKALSIGKPAALDLVKQVRGGHIDIAK